MIMIRMKKLYGMIALNQAEVVTDAHTQSPVFVYKINNNTASNFQMPPDSTNYRKAKRDIESGTIDCKDPGGNCLTTLKSNFNNPSTICLLFSSRFKITNLNEKMASGELKLYRGKNYYELKSVRTQNSYYITY